MSKEKAGLVKAHCPGKGLNGKSRYLTIGAMFRDTASGNFSIKLDFIPVGDSGWSGWCNVFQETAMDRPEKDGSKFSPPDDSDIPF
jgi:hypothetical protein